jgi:integrase
MPSSLFDPAAAVSGHVFLYDGKRRSTWCAKWRDHTGQHEKRLAPAWTGRGAPPEGFMRKRDAEMALEALLVDARRGQLQQTRTGLRFEDVAEDWFKRGCFERDWSASTRVDYRSMLDAHLLPTFGAQPPEKITAKEIEAWRDGLTEDGTRTRRTANKLLTALHGVLAHGVEYHALHANPAARVRRLRESNDARRFDFYSPEEIALLVATAAKGTHRKRQAVTPTEKTLQASEDKQDAALFLTAALSGLRRSELLALRWEDIDFQQASIRVYEAFSAKQAGTPKSRKSRVIPMVAKVADTLTDLKTREHHTTPRDLVFTNRDGTPLDGSALRRRYIATLKEAGLRRLRFHDLRHTFGSLAINVASIVQVQAWMGHADINTTMRYLHHKSHKNDAQLLATAFTNTTTNPKPRLANEHTKPS